MVVPGWVAAALVIVRVCRPWTPSVPLFANWIAPPWVIATGNRQKQVSNSDIKDVVNNLKIRLFKTCNVMMFPVITLRL